MKKLIFLLLLFIVGSCKERESVGPNRADDFAGVYYTNVAKDNRTSNYIWVITRKANNRIGIGYYIDDSFKIGNQGTTTRKRDVYFLENVIVNPDSSFSINESVEGVEQPVKLSGSGRLFRGENGAAGLNVSIDFIGSDNKAVRNSENMVLTKVPNVLDEDQRSFDFDYPGNYETELPEGAKTAYHKWAVSTNSHSSVSVDYKIRDKYNQGTIGELINNYVLNDAKKVGSRGLAIDMAIKEEVSRDEIRVKAVGTKLLRGESDTPIIATIVKISNVTQGINRIEYLEMKKQF